MIALEEVLQSHADRFRRVDGEDETNHGLSGTAGAQSVLTGLPVRPERGPVDSRDANNA